MLPVAERYAGLGYLAPGGVLDLPMDGSVVRAIRIEVANDALILESAGIDAPGAEDLARSANVTASSWHGNTRIEFDPARLFDVDRPTGPVIHTEPDHPAWAEIRFRRPLRIERLRLRFAPDADGRQARGLRVSARSRWRTRQLHDGRAELQSWRRHAEAAKAAAGRDPEAGALLDALDLVVRGRYERAHRVVISRVADEADRRLFGAAVNRTLLPARGLAWTGHGPKRPFRYWTERERVAYVADSARVVEALRSLTPNVCFGFGSVLAIVRDGALIPHDDDMDIIVGFEPAEAPTIGDGLRLVAEHLRAAGYGVSGSLISHWHVHLSEGRVVDVFVGIIEGDAVSWYPAARRSLTRDIVFPPGRADLLGTSCAVPAQPESVPRAGVRRWLARPGPVLQTPVGPDGVRRHHGVQQGMTRVRRRRAVRSWPIMWYRAARGAAEPGRQRA